MRKPFIISNFLRELQYGFYVDINPENDDNSLTKILDSEYKWRGISIVNNDVNFNRSVYFKKYTSNLDNTPEELVNVLYRTHPGTMIHYLIVNNIFNLSNLFNAIYEEDVLKPYSISKIYPHLNFICIEIPMMVTNDLTNQLYDQFDLIPVKSTESSNIFVNEVMSYLV